MINKRDFLEKQLAHYYDWILRDKNQSVTTRCWCITIWMASVAWIVAMSDKIHLNFVCLVIIIDLPVFLFWLLDAFQNSFIDINEQYARKIEAILISDELESMSLGEHLLMSNHNNTVISLKIKSFFVSLFLRETVSFVYLVLFLVSTLLIVFISN
jgi:hypothetical protein